MLTLRNDHSLFSLLDGFDSYFLDSLAVARLTPLLLSMGKTMFFNVSLVENTQVLGCTNPVFILLDPVCAPVINQITRLCRMLSVQCARLYTTVAAAVNAKAFGLAMDGADYPNTPIKVISSEMGPLLADVRRLSVELQDFMVFPKLHDLHTDQMELAFHDLNGLLWEIQALEEVYSLGNDAGKVAEQFASQFSPALDRKKWLCATNQGATACVIFVNDLALIDPVACVEPYIKPNHLLDSVFAELCPDGHSLRVNWESMTTWKDSCTNPEWEDTIPSASFFTDLLNTPELGAHVMFSRQLMLKEQEALTAIQQDIQDVADTVNYSLPELTKIPRNKAQWAELFLREVRELLIPICDSGKLDLLTRMELAMAVSLALSASTNQPHDESNADSDMAHTSPGKLLTRYERSLLVASQLDAKLLSKLEEPRKCEPIVMQAVNQARQLTYLDDMFFFFVYILSLLPAQSPISTLVWRSITDLFDTGKRVRKSDSCYPGSLIPSCISVTNLIQNLKDLREERRKLPCYNCLWSSQPRYRSPLVQLVGDLRTASLQPKEASPALKGLKHHVGLSRSAGWLSGFRRFDPLGGSAPHHASNASHTLDYVILVIMGSVPFALVRDLLETAQGHAERNSPFQLKIVANGFTGGFSGLSGFFKMEE